MTTARYVVMGVSGSGKSVIGAQLAAALGVAFVEGDDVHPPENRARMASGIPLTDADRAPWLATLAGRLAAATHAEVGLVVSCSALKRAYRDALRQGAPDVQFIYLRGERAILAQRLVGRAGHFMPVTLLDSQLATLEQPEDDEGAWVADIALPPDVLVKAVLERVVSWPHDS